MVERILPKLSAENRLANMYKVEARGQLYFLSTMGSLCAQIAAVYHDLGPNINKFDSSHLPLSICNIANMTLLFLFIVQNGSAMNDKKLPALAEECAVPSLPDISDRLGPVSRILYRRDIKSLYTYNKK